jgi:hypothetical protein
MGCTRPAHSPRATFGTGARGKITVLSESMPGMRVQENGLRRRRPQPIEKPAHEFRFGQLKRK